MPDDADHNNMGDWDSQPHQNAQMLKRLSHPKCDRKESTISAGEGKNHKCGVGVCKPKCLEGCANIKAYCAVLSLMLLFHFVYFSYSIGVIRTVEKRFGLPSYQTGLVQSSSDIVQVVLVVVVGYLGRKTHKPRYLSLGALLSVAAIFLAATPFFIYGPYQYDAQQKTMMSENGGHMEYAVVSNTSAPPTIVMGNEAPGSPGPMKDIDYQTCDSKSLNLNTTTEKCGADGSTAAESSKTALVIFYISSILMGFGTAGLVTLGISFIDENVKKEDSALYIGITTSMFALGPIIGFSLAAFCTRLPEDLGEMKVSPYNPEFIGCWWLGHVIVGTLLLIVCIPMFMFPKHFRAYYDYCKTERKPRDGARKATVTSEIKEFPKALWKLLSNPAYMILCFSKVFAMYYIIGILINITRYIEIHFGQPAFVANMASAVCGALTGAGGNFFGGFIMKKFKLEEKGSTLLYSFALSSILVGLIIMMSLPCSQTPTAYDGQPLTKFGYDVDLQCNSNCSCSRDRYQPVCTPEGVEYFSPCHAGCRTEINSTTFSECSCIPEETQYLSGDWCGRKCNLFVPYIVTYAVMSLFGSMSNVPITILTFRLVDPELKSFALGIISALHNVLVFIPGPIIFGTLFDSACHIWRTVCGSRMSCLVYDNARYRYYMHGVSISFEALALLLTFCLFFVIRYRLNKIRKTDLNKNELDKLNGKHTVYSDDENDKDPGERSKIYRRDHV